MKEKHFDLMTAFLIAIIAFFAFNISRYDAAEQAAAQVNEIYHMPGVPDDVVLEYPFEFINEETGFWNDRERDILERKGHDCVTVTVYNALPGQCNADYLTTASGRKIVKARLNEGELRWVALSRDLLEKYPYGSAIYLDLGENNEYTGEYLVADTMNVRYTKCVDILVPDHIKNGKWPGIINKEKL